MQTPGAIDGYRHRFDPGLLQLADVLLCEQEAVGDDGHIHVSGCQRLCNLHPVLVQKNLSSDQGDPLAAQVRQLPGHVQAFLGRELILAGLACLRTAVGTGKAAGKGDLPDAGIKPIGYAHDQEPLLKSRFSRDGLGGA